MMGIRTPEAAMNAHERARQVCRGLNFTIPDEAWQDYTAEHEAEDGRSPAPRSRLYASLAINGVGFHCEAIEAHIDAHDMFEAKDPYWEKRLQDLYALLGGDGPMELMEIGDKEYAVFLSPFC